MHRTVIEDAETDYLAGLPASAPRSAARGSVVIPFPSPAYTAAYEAWEEEAGGLDHFLSIGSLAVTIVGNLSVPRLVVFSGKPRAFWEELHLP